MATRTGRELYRFRGYLGSRLSMCVWFILMWFPFSLPLTLLYASCLSSLCCHFLLCKGWSVSQPCSCIESLWGKWIKSYVTAKLHIGKKLLNLFSKRMILNTRAWESIRLLLTGGGLSPQLTHTAASRQEGMIPNNGKTPLRRPTHLQFTGQLNVTLIVWLLNGAQEKIL